MAAVDQVSSTECSEASPVSSLPDDALLAVLRWLDVAELLAARAVCRRWRAMALHPVLWRTRRLKSDDENLPPRLRRAVLRLAPCAAFLKLDNWDLRVLGAVPLSTCCAVAELKLSYVTANTGAMLAARVIHCQAALGRLRKLSVSICESSKKTEHSGFALVDLLAELHRVEGLVELRMTFFGTDFKLPGWSSCAVPAEPLPASLKVLRYKAAELFPHAAFQLRSHAATLTEVSLRGVRWPSGPLAELLKDISGLRSLQCPLLDDMRPLLQCGRLRTLAMEPGYSGEAAGSASVRAAVENAKAFFSQATKLRRLCLVYWDHFGAELVGALASSGRSELRTLIIVEEDMPTFSADDFRNMRLPGLPALHDILFTADDDDETRGKVSLALLEVLATCGVPSLRVVSGHAKNCSHELVHEPALAAAMRRNPGLHILTSNLCCWRDEALCDACAQECECNPSFQPEGGGCGICGHSEAGDKDCSLVAEHKDDYYDLWARVRTEQD